MNIRKVHCFFEQSGTFKQAFINLGIAAEDYDIQNNFGETDNIVDLFQAINDAYCDLPSIIDKVAANDLIIAFFPCIYFCENNQLYFMGKHQNLRNLSTKQRADTILLRSRRRQYFYEVALKLFTICETRKIRLIVENPYAAQHFLINNFPYSAAVIDHNRTRRGDFYKKPTQYWFVNCKPTYGKSFQKTKIRKSIASAKPAAHGGLCSEDRSMISADYARNFICDFIIGKEQFNSERTFFSNI